MSLVNYQLNGVGFNNLFNTENNDYYGNIATKFSVAGTDIGETTSVMNFSTVAGTITPCGFTTPILQYNTGAAWAFSTSTPVTSNLFWFGVAMSGTGQYAIGCVDGGGIFYSSDYGVTWTASNATARNHRIVSMSNSGQYAVACVYGGTIYYSSNYGQTWTASSGSINWRSVAMSGSGQYAVACVDAANGLIYYSRNSGQTWSASNSLLKNWYYVSMSASGQYAVACGSNTQNYYSNDYGQTWTVSSLANSGGRGTSMSASGKYALSCFYSSNGSSSVFYSSTFGQSWTASNSPLVDWFSVSMSGTGKYCVACASNGKIYYSTDYGINWSISSSITDNWYSVAISGDGQNAIAGVGDGRIYYSTNTSTATVSQDLTTVFEPLYKYKTWISTNSPRSWSSISCSNDGRYVVASTTGTPLIYYSSNFGASWIVATINNDTGVNWYEVSMSNTGQYAVACQYTATGRIYYSSNYGATWALSTSSATGYWLSIAISSSGRYAVANRDTGSTASGAMYYSSDFGVTWSASTTGNPNVSSYNMALSSTGKYGISTTGFTTSTYGVYYTSTNGVTWTRSASLQSFQTTGCAMSASGQYAIAGAQTNGQIYYSNDFGVTWNASNSVSADWRGGSMSDSGQYCTFALLNEKIYYSTDYGVNWTDAVVASGISTDNMAISKNGQYAFLTTPSGTLWRCVATNNDFYLEPTKTYPTWTSVATPSAPNKTMVAMGSNYAIMLVYGGGVYLSSNYGQNWTLKSSAILPTANWKSCSMSDDGQYQVAGISGGNVYYSNTFGSTWSVVSTQPARSWDTLAMSGTGQYVIAPIINASIIRSSNYGQSYESSTSVFDNYLNSASSSTGQYQVAASGTDNSGQGRIYYSSDFGVSFNYSTSFVGRAWRGICMSSDGQIVYSAITAGQIYKSTDYGVNFSLLASSPTTTWIYGSTNSTGQYVIFSSTTTIYYSSDYGASWNAIASPTASLIWNSVAVSKDGLRATAVVSGGLAYYANAVFV